MSAAGRTPAEAVAPFLGALQRAVSCVSNHVLVASGYRPEDGPHRIAPSRGEDLVLSGPTSLRLRFGLGYEIRASGEPGEEWRVAASSYAVILERADGPELVAFHRHPLGPSPTRWPHLHVGRATGAEPPFTHTHLPTGGPVPLQQIVRYAVLDLGVRPRRPDWAAILG